MKIKMTVLCLIMLLCCGVFAVFTVSGCGKTCDHTLDHTCKTVKCDDCGEKYFSGHSIVRGVCEICGTATETPAESFTYEIADGKVTITEFIGQETGIIIPDTIEGYPVVTIGENAFCDTAGEKAEITSMTLGKNIKAIEDKGFYGLKITNLNLTAATSLTTIGDYAFGWCVDLASITLPNSLISIGEGAFFADGTLTSIVIPASVTSICNAAFSGCDSLTSIKVDTQNAVYFSEGNAIITKGDNTLIKGCKTTIIPTGVVKIDDYAFSDFSGLESIEIPNTVTEIGNFAFKNCLDLTSITIPNSVTTVGVSAFVLCSKLAHVIIGSGITSINASMFSMCMSLKTITIPDTVESIEYAAFDNCWQLESIVIGSRIQTIDSYAFTQCYQLDKILL